MLPLECVLYVKPLVEYSLLVLLEKKERSEGEGTVYDRIEKLEDEIATLRNEIDVIKHAFRNELARHEVKMIKKGHDVSSIID